MPIVQICLDGETRVQADVKKGSCIAVHRSADGKAWRLTHVPSGLGLTRVRLKKDALDMRKRLDALDWSDPKKIEDQACTVMGLLK